ncbi:MAG: glycosyltransferase family 2 protein [Patescibacteria group bacterium]
MKLPLSVIILTYNEELNIENCLKNIVNWAEEIFIVDSYSADKTLKIAKKYEAKIIQHSFENQAQQFNWALDNLEIKNDWILRLDADEYLTEELKNEIIGKLKNTADDISGFYIKRRVYFMGRWIRHGGYYPIWLLRLFRKNKAKSELRAMDEHIVLLNGKGEKLKNDFIDDNKKDLTWWIEKHNNYASREAGEVMNYESGIMNYGGKIEGQVARKRWLKEKFYYRLPIFFRAFFYFIYRYIIRFGFLDGAKGLIFHFLQGFWYRFLVDSKIYEAEKRQLYSGD